MILCQKKMLMTDTYSLSLVEDLFARPISAKGPLEGFIATAQVLENLRTLGQHPLVAMAD